MGNQSTTNTMSSLKNRNILLFSFYEGSVIVVLSMKCRLLLQTMHKNTSYRIDSKSKKCGCIMSIKLWSSRLWCHVGLQYGTSGIFVSLKFLILHPVFTSLILLIALFEQNSSASWKKHVLCCNNCSVKYALFYKMKSLIWKIPQHKNKYK